MKLTHNESPVELGEGQSAPQQFQIKAGREAFRILSSGLYNDKKQAIIRELCCNAYDAHVAAGKKEVPFELHLPTQWEPFFSVKDFGIGLSHEEMLSLYTTYFGTNKSESNAFVGALGLGSKSPFCYTEGFTVISRFNGMTRIYSAYVDDGGTPAIVLQSEEDTPNAVNGLEVSFPVNTNDCWEFSNKAEVALEFFDPKPIINVTIHIQKQKYDMKTDLWGIRNRWESGSTHQTSSVRAIQGMVPYSVGNIDTSKLTEIQQKMMKMQIDIFFPIGELSITASREVLSNDERTIKNVIARLDMIIDEYFDKLKAEIDACKTEWEARLLIHTYISRGNELSGMVNAALNDGRLNGKYKAFTLSADSATLSEVDYNFTTVIKFEKSGRSRYDAKKDKVFWRNPEELKIAKQLAAAGTAQKDAFEVDIEVGPQVVFLIGDITHGGEKYIHYMLQQANDTKYSTVYLFCRSAKEWTVDQVKREAVKMLQKLGNPPVLLLSDLKTKYQEFMKAPVTPSGEVVKREIFQFDTGADIGRFGDGGYERAGWLNGWNPITEVPAGRKFYVLLRRLRPEPSKLEPKGFQYAENFGKFIEQVIASKEFDFCGADRVYGLPVDSPELKKNPADWVEFQSYVWARFLEIMTPEKEMSLSLLIKCFDSSFGALFRSLARTPQLASDSKLQKFAVDYQKAKVIDETAGKNLLGLAATATNRGIYPGPTNTVSFEARWRKVRTHYPLLDTNALTNSAYWNEEQLKDVIEYVKQKDADMAVKKLLAQSIQNEEGEVLANVVQ